MNLKFLKRLFRWSEVDTEPEITIKKIPKIGSVWIRAFHDVNNPFLDFTEPSLRYYVREIRGDYVSYEWPFASVSALRNNSTSIDKFFEDFQPSPIQ